ncbi:hypothetical protein CN172_26900 [Sinorhizobium meliloti]|nr:hypothetical protein CN232_28910 [Sinorhizobium meliloti]RVH38254.1 hypothetical protein CN208_29580 [Sinorhizobium meliloti]RVK07372.1 hypothetical protein CN172_26900 [Sinorhizobium meliloti]
MNAFWASENCDAFIVFRSFPSQENAPENSNQNWSSLKGSDQTETAPFSTWGLGETGWCRAAMRWNECRAKPEPGNGISRVLIYGRARWSGFLRSPGIRSVFVLDKVSRVPGIPFSGIRSRRLFWASWSFRARYDRS